jgi:3-oxoacyl-[acyl-carrier-protein] synthase II
VNAIGPIITGSGLVTALASGVEETWNALAAGEFIRAHSPAKLRAIDGQTRVTQLALAAGSEALAAARWGQEVLRDERTALLIGTSRGPVNQWLADPARPQIGMHRVGDEVATAIGLGFGPRVTYSAACASGLQALIRAVLMIRGGEADRAVVIAAEAALHPLFLACFDRLGVLPREGVGCRPFDQRREGFLVSEAAAAVCLERSESARALAIIDRVALGSDATTITGADPSGAVLQRMLRHVTADHCIDLVHAHGTATKANDPVELTAIERCCGDARPIVYSHKGALGHSLGASGLVSLVLSCEMHRRGTVLGNVRTNQPIPMRQARCFATPQTVNVRRSACLAAGFGGPVAAVSLLGP